MALYQLRDNIICRIQRSRGSLLNKDGARNLNVFGGANNQRAFGCNWLVLLLQGTIQQTPTAQVVYSPELILVITTLF
jgi:hypothetical protein